MKKAPFDDKLNDKLLKILEEERASRKAIQESETKFRTLFESAIDAIFIMDDDKFIDCNQSTLKIFGCSSHPEILGLPPYEFSPPLQPDGRDSREKALEMINRAFNGENLRFYWKHAKKDGTAFDAEVTLNRFMVNDKYYLLAIVRDIDEITAIQEKLHLSEERYRLISEVAYDYMFSAIVKDDNTFDLDWVAGAFEKITGYTFEEFKAIGGWQSTVHPEDMETAKHNFELLKRNRKVISELRRIKKNGDIVWVKFYAHPVFDEANKKLIRIYGAVQDITERKNAEFALKQLEENFHRSIAESPLGIRIVTPEGVTVYANKSFLDIFGYRNIEEYDLTPSIEKYTTASYSQHVLRKEKRRIGEDVLDYEISIRRKDGEIRDLKVIRKEILWNGKKHFQVIYQDITEQNNLTRELIAAKEKAEESNRLKTAFLQNVSHEIRTPMNSIMGFMELLKNPNMLREERESFIRMIQESGERLLRTINDIIEISKIETGIVDVRVTTED
ncbi:MAG TPA: PAS domain S-box protein, partial [Bacteroidales bacterium]|nr:PAS domain S-box protein [Bacteroidales bacterium]